MYDDGAIHSRDVRVIHMLKIVEPLSKLHQWYQRHRGLFVANDTDAEGICRRRHRRRRDLSPLALTSKALKFIYLEGMNYTYVVEGDVKVDQLEAEGMDTSADAEFRHSKN